MASLASLSNSSCSVGVVEPARGGMDHTKIEDTAGGYYTQRTRGVVIDDSRSRSRLLLKGIEVSTEANIAPSSFFIRAACLLIPLASWDQGIDLE